MIVCDYEKCTGCMACKNVCPKGAIGVTYDNTYKIVPFINESLCVNCDLCRKICPAVNEKEYNKSFKCYAAGKRKSADTKTCSSAGVSAAFCEFVIKEGGLAFGAGYENGKLLHLCAETIEKAELLKGSKYVQSDMDFSFREAEKKLKEGKMVLFTGTPCQIAGLYAYLGKDYENLVTVDLICHGVPSAKFLDEYLKECRIDEKYTKITFRQGEEYNLTVFKEDKIIFKKNAAFDPYYRAFYNNLTLRDNCFLCKYATVNSRPADISIGDFWGIDIKSLKTPIEGNISVILLNTKKGEWFLENSGIPVEERPLEEAVKGNAQLKAPSKRNADTDIFLENFPRGFKYAINKTCVKKNIKTNKQDYRKEMLKGAVKKILRKN